MYVELKMAEKSFNH